MVDIKDQSADGYGRYKVEGLEDNPELADHIESKLLGEESILDADVNIKNGTVGIKHLPSLSHFSVASLVEKIVTFFKKSFQEVVGLFPGSEKKSLHRTAESKNPHRRIKSELQKVDRQLVELWHAMEAKEVLNTLGSDKHEGLSEEQVDRLLEKYGPNKLMEQKERSEFSILFEQFKSAPVAMLGIAAVVSVATGGVADAVVILAVVGINSAIGYFTESRSEKTIRSLRTIMKPSATVVRYGEIEDVDATELVPGDVILLTPGSYIPADARLVKTHKLTVDESALTGESLPVKKHAKVLDLETNTEVPLGDRTNMVYMGTMVTGGEGKAVVVATGSATEIGRIQMLVGSTETPSTPMEKQLDHIGTQLAILSSAVCAGVFVIGLLRGYGLLEMLKSSISLAVAAVPEGLPTVATTILALGIKEMKKHKVLIRHLDAVETLGTAQAICLDKTGTLTKNKMSVTHIRSLAHTYDIDETDISVKGKPIQAKRDSVLHNIMKISVLCSDSEIIHREGSYIVNGSSTENALVYMAINGGLDVGRLRREYPAERMVHRSEKRRYMVSAHIQDDGKHWLALKGSPVEVLEKCEWYIDASGQHALTDDLRTKVLQQNEQMAGNALRVLAFAYGISDSTSIKGVSFIWLGLTGMIDPIRSGVKGTIQGFHTAGIDTIMITGDQSATAYAIGKELELSRSENFETMDSTNLNNIDPEALKGIAKRVNVFSRVSPTNKLQIVQALQRSGRVVAMTGDGINDSPALKAADIGIAMGSTGTDVAREVADVILEDDNLETMIVAVKQGRTIYNNIRKSIHYLLSTNISEIAVMFVSLAAGIGQPLNAMQLLWINLMTDVAPSLALAMEPPEPDILEQPPRNPDEPIIRKADFARIGLESVFITAGAMASYGYGVRKYGVGPVASGMAFQSLTTAQILHAFSSRSRHHSIIGSRLPPNRYLDIAIASSLAIQGLTVILPPLRRFLGIAQILPADILVVASGAGLPLIITELTKGIGVKH